VATLVGVAGHFLTEKPLTASLKRLLAHFPMRIRPPAPV
jgi:hypothetical protein